MNTIYKNQSKLEQNNKQVPFTVPDGYFDNFTQAIEQRAMGDTKTFRRYLMAASILLTLLIGGYFYQTRQTNSDDWYANYLLTQIDEATVYDFYFENQNNY